MNVETNILNPLRLRLLIDPMSRQIETSRPNKMFKISILILYLEKKKFLSFISLIILLQLTNCQYQALMHLLCVCKFISPIINFYILYTVQWVIRLSFLSPLFPLFLISLSLFHSLSHTLSLFLFHTHTISHCASYSISLFLSLFLSLSLSHTLAHSLAHSLDHSLSPSTSLSLSFTQTHYLTLSVLPISTFFYWFLLICLSSFLFFLSLSLYCPPPKKNLTFIQLYFDFQQSYLSSVQAYLPCSPTQS
jgi:hypothetical protein